MASKKDPAFRTKAKASSSAEAALLSGGGFVGFDSAYGVGDVQHVLSPEYQLAFKKLAKKDTITKLKGLHELEALFPALDDSSKTAVLERWVQAFNNTGLDNDRQVREGLHHAFSILIERVKKDLAVYLKSIITVWLLNQHDTYREVRNAAQTSFKSAISKKQSEALLFCKQEMLVQLGEYLAHTPQTLSDVKAVGEAEANDRWERVVSASISCIDYLLDQIPAADLPKLEPGLSALLDAKFWKFLTSRSALIRRSTYQLVASACLKAQHLIAPHMKTLAPIIIGAFSDKEAITHSAMWPAMLCFLKAFPAAWEEVNARKAIWPRLNAFLNSGCYGSAPTSYPSLLPFMQLIPASVIGQQPSEFYIQVLNSIWTALGSEGSITQADASAALKAFSEVTLFASITLTKGGAPAEAVAVLNGPFASAIVGWLSAPQPRIPTAAFLSCVNDVISKLTNRGETFAALLSGCWTQWTAAFEATTDRDASARWTELLPALLAIQSPPVVPAPAVAETAAALPVTVAAAPSAALTYFVATIAGRSLTIAQSSGSPAALTLLARIASSVGLNTVAPQFYAEKLLPAISSQLTSATASSADMQSALRGLLKAHLASLPPNASAADFAALLTSLSSIEPAAQIRFLAPLLQDANVTPSPALDSLCLAASQLTDGGVASLAVLVQRGVLSNEAVTRLADNLKTVTASNTAAATLAAALVPQLPSTTASQLLHSLLSLRISADSAVAAAAKPLFAPTVLARLDVTQRTSLATAAEALFPSQLLTSNAQALADFAFVIVELRGLAVGQPAAQELLLRLCGTEADWFSVAHQATVDVKGVDYGHLSVSPPLSTLSPSAPLTFTQCATRAHLAVLLLQRGLLQQQASIDASLVGPLLSAVSLFAILSQCSEAHTSNAWSGLLNLNFSSATLTTLAAPALWAGALPISFAWASKIGGALAASTAFISKLAATPLPAAVCPTPASAFASQALVDTECALLHVNGLPADFASAISKQALRVVLPSGAVDPDALQAGAEVLAAYYAVNVEEDMRLLSLITQHQAMLASLPDQAGAPRVHASLAGMHASVIGKLSNAALLPSQLEFLLARVVDYLRCADASEAGLLLRYRALALLAALQAYVKRWTSQPLPNAVVLMKQVATGIVKQLCLIVGSSQQLRGSVCSLAAALEQAVTNDKLIGLDVETPDELYSALLVPELSLQRTVYVVLSRASVKQAETLLAKIKPNAADSGAVSENLEVEKHVDTVLPNLLKHTLESERVINALITQDEQAATIDTVGLALTWSALLDLLQNTQLRSKVTPYLRETRITSRFMTLLFAFIEHSPTVAPKSLVHAPLEVIASIDATAESLNEVCALLFLRSLRILPALVRSWWADDCDRGALQQIEKYCTKFISPLLIDAEIQQVAEAKKEAGCVIKGSRGVQEVTAAYEKDELTIEITIRMPPSYPLRCVEVESPRRKGMTEALWRKWLLSMTTLLVTQDASILDAILLWKRSLDSHFDGVESCPICYAVFHPANYSLPRLACKTCKNKFHHACMYKWFQTSHKSTCPLCQTPFSFDKNL